MGRVGGYSGRFDGSIAVPEPALRRVTRASDSQAHPAVESVGTSDRAERVDLRVYPPPKFADGSHGAMKHAESTSDAQVKFELLKDSNLPALDGRQTADPHLEAAYPGGRKVLTTFNEGRLGFNRTLAVSFRENQPVIRDWIKRHRNGADDLRLTIWHEFSKPIAQANYLKSKVAKVTAVTKTPGVRRGRKPAEPEQIKRVGYELGRQDYSRSASTIQWDGRSDPPYIAITHYGVGTPDEEQQLLAQAAEADYQVASEIHADREPQLLGLLDQKRLEAAASTSHESLSPTVQVEARESGEYPSL